MTNSDIIKIAKRQSAIDYGYELDEVEEKKYVVLSPKPLNTHARKYLKQSPFLDFTYYGDTLIAIADDKIRTFIEAFLEKYKNEVYRVFDAPHMNKLIDKLKKHKMCIAHIADYYLPDLSFNPVLNENIDLKILIGDEIKALYDDKRFNMALSYSRDSIRRDEIAVVGYIQGQIAGVAACTNDCDTMWQIGIDVLEEFRNQKVASTLTYRLSQEILKLGKVPFYCTAYSNIASRNTARKAGFKSSWVSLTFKSVENQWIKEIIK